MADKKNDLTKVTRLKLSNLEKANVQNIQSVMGILQLQREGLGNSMVFELARIKKRFNHQFQ